MTRKFAIAALGTLVLASAATASPAESFGFDASMMPGGEHIALTVMVAPDGGEAPCHIVFTPYGGDPMPVAGCSRMSRLWVAPAKAATNGAGLSPAIA